MSRWITVLTFCLGGSFAWAQNTQPTFSAPKGAKVFFKNLKKGAKVKQKFKVKFGVRGMKVRKAGEDPEDHKTGHHHLIIDGGPLALGEVVPTDETHMHFGKGQTEAEIALIPGTHKLTLQFADGAHRSYGPKLSATMNVKVR